MGQQTAPRPPAAEPCGPLGDAERLLELEHFTPLFTSEGEEEAESRANRGLEMVLLSEPIYVVERRQDCARIAAAAFRILNDEILSGRPVTRSTENWAVLRFGPYYLVPIYSRPSELVAVQGYGQVLIFVDDDDDGLRFVGWFLG